MEKILFIDYVKTTPLLNEKEKDLIVNKISSKQIDENVSQETIRLREHAIIEKLSMDVKNRDFIDDEYSLLVGNVILDCENMLNDIEVISSMYYAKKFKKTKKRHDKIGIYTFLSKHFKDLSTRVQEKIIRYYNPIITESGSVYPTYNGDYIVELLRLDGPLTRDEIISACENKRHVVRDNGDKPKNERYFASVIPVNKRIIRTEDKKLMFYNVDKFADEINNLISEIKFPVEQGKYNISEILEDNKKLFKEANISNAYEAHSLLRHYEDKLPPNIELGRVPMIIVT